jgi:hypothetical protein
MSSQTRPTWHAMRTDESRMVEELVRKQFPNADAYRFNSASLRLRVIDERFRGKSIEERDAMIEPLLDQLPAATQSDIINLLTLTPEEAVGTSRHSLANVEFEDPSPSML